MKLRLPRHLILAFVLASSVLPSMAAVRHTDVSLNTYVDFATNSGRYATGVTNELLDYIRSRDGGVTIHYTGGQEDYVLRNGMISFDSVADDGNMTVVGYNYVVTVAHNSSQMYPTFSGHDYGIGDEKAIKYVTVEEYGTQKNFVNDIADYKLSRLTKLVTDAPVVQMAGGSGTDYKGQLVYRTAGGYQKIRDAEGKISDETEKLAYQVGGVGSITNWGQTSDPSVHIADISGTTSWDSSGVGAGSPLPFGGQQGDSGSPYFVWDDSTESFKLLMVHSGSYDEKLGKPEHTIGYEATDWAKKAIQSDSFCVDMSKVSGGVLKINGADIDSDGPTMSDVYSAEFKDPSGQIIKVEKKYTVQVAQAFLTNEADETVYDKQCNAYLRAVKTGEHTWKKDLSELKDTATWYAYGDKYLNAGVSVTVDKEHNPHLTEGLTYAQLFMTQNLVLEAGADKAEYTVNVTRDTDLGAGYVHFAANGKKEVTFNVESEKSNLLNSAGYVVDAGVQVNVSLRNWESDYMREWRKVGEGTLNICGKNGNNEIFLNVGGTGKTLLNQSDGYAAYNVLVNTGSTVVIKDTSQIYRDLTFGNGGGVLDMNGNSMDWYMTKGQTRTKAFTINALTEEAVITNNSATHAELTYKESGDTRFVGSFRDSKDSSLGITYSVEGGTWELNSIRTSLTNENSGLTVEKGTVKLAGTLTVHGYGTKHTAYSADFSTSANDWHYADAAMNVTVKNGATFELESHARLTGTVTVETGGSYIMHEGVQNAMEYIEGGEKEESTAAIADYYGHKGDVKLEGTGMLTWMRGDKEVATLKTNGAGTAEMAKVESTISSETQLRLAAAKEETGRISAAALALQTGVSLELCGLYVDAASAISSANGANVSLHESTLELSSANTLSSTATLETALTLNLCGDTTSVMALAAGTEVLDLKSSILSGTLILSCDQLVLDLRSLETPVNGWVRVSFGDNVKFADPGEMTLSAMVDVGYAAGYYSDAHVGFVYFYIPEPATTSLSLLALAALAARRRRK